MQAGVSIPSADCVLEAQLLVTNHQPCTGTEISLGVIVIHPHASLGGSMADPVVSALYRAAARCVQVKAVLRYNQRGVGQSTGKTSLFGGASFADITAVCKYLLTIDDAPTQLLIIGYSFGGCIGAHALQLEEVTAFMAVSPPIGFLANLTLGTKEHFKRVQHFRGPVKIVIGSSDKFASTSAAQKVVADIQTARHAGNQTCTEEAGCELQVCDSCDHFWRGHLATLADSTSEWIGRL